MEEWSATMVAMSGSTKERMQALDELTVGGQRTDTSFTPALVIIQYEPWYAEGNWDAMLTTRRKSFAEEILLSESSYANS
jgi:hypothetical protein